MDLNEAKNMSGSWQMDILGISLRELRREQVCYIYLNNSFTNEYQQKKKMGINIILLGKYGLYEQAHKVLI